MLRPVFSGLVPNLNSRTSYSSLELASYTATGLRPRRISFSFSIMYHNHTILRNNACTLVRAGHSSTYASTEA